jgi:hypothetical protein
MLTYEEAVQIDIEGDILRASEAYEAIISQSHPPVAAYINLACVYWLHLEVGPWSDIKFRDTADRRLFEVLSEAKGMYGDYPEVIFWTHYIKYIHLGDDLIAPENILELAQQSNSTIVPYFYLYSDTKNPLYLPQIRALVQIARCQPTCKNRYILSMVERYVRDDPLMD